MKNLTLSIMTLILLITLTLGGFASSGIRYNSLADIAVEDYNTYNNAEVIEASPDRAIFIDENGNKVTLTSGYTIYFKDRYASSDKNLLEDLSTRWVKVNE